RAEHITRHVAVRRLRRHGSSPQRRLRLYAPFGCVSRRSASTRRFDASRDGDVRLRPRAGCASLCRLASGRRGKGDRERTMSTHRIERRDATLQLAGAPEPIAVTLGSPRVVRVSFGPSVSPELSYVAPRAWTPPPFEITEGPVVRLVTSDLRLDVQADPFRLTFADADGAWLLREPADGGMRVERGAHGAARVQASFAFEGEQHFYGL